MANFVVSLLKGVDPKDGIPYEKKFCEGENVKVCLFVPTEYAFSCLRQLKGTDHPSEEVPDARIYTRPVDIYFHEESKGEMKRILVRGGRM